MNNKEKIHVGIFTYTILYYTIPYHTIPSAPTYLPTYLT